MWDSFLAFLANPWVCTFVFMGAPLLYAWKCISEEGDPKRFKGKYSSNEVDNEVNNKEKKEKQKAGSKP